MKILLLQWNSQQLGQCLKRENPPTSLNELMHKLNQINFCSTLRTSLRVPKAPAGTGDVFHAQMMLPPLGPSGAGPAGWTGDGYGGCLDGGWILCGVKRVMIMEGLNRARCVDGALRCGVGAVSSIFSMHLACIYVVWTDEHRRQHL